MLGSPSSYLLVVGLAATAWAKVSVLRGAGSAAAAPGCLAFDGVLAFGLAGLLSLAEARRRWLVATLPIATAFAGAMVVNAIYLGISGEPLSWPAVELGLERFGDVRAIAGEALARKPVWAISVLLAVGLLVPAASAWAVRTVDRARASVERAHAATALALVCGALLAVPIGAAGSGIDRLARSGVVDSWWGLATGAESAPREREMFRGYDRAPLVAPGALDPASGPDVLIVVWESTRFDHTSLAGDAALASTPNLAALAARGAHAPIARAVVPHTTKSLFSILCGRLPLLQSALVELSADVPPDCLPAAMARAGWATALFQSAAGNFEHRPRFAANLGFGQFEAREDIGGHALGYLASDDETLAEPFSRWLDTLGSRRFMAVVLTSAPHHPYTLPPRTLERVRDQGAQANTAAHRYARLVEAEDHLLGALLAALAQHGRAERAIVVVAGDHGEGFGDRGVRQHDNNYFEEGLRVPLVFVGPGIPSRELAGNASLVDVTPTLLGRLGVTAPAGLDGVDLFAAAPEGPRWFSCFIDNRCHGFVIDRRKVVVVPETRSAFWFDLERDPQERRPQPLDGELDQLAQLLGPLLDSHRVPSWNVKFPEIRLGAWHCPAQKPCARR